MDQSSMIVVVGSLNMDVIFRAPKMPEAGETILGGQFSTAPGGKGANQAVAAARLGGKVAMVGRIGDDEFGHSILANLQRDQIDTSRVLVTEDSATGVALILLEESGENRIIVASGANHAITAQDILQSAGLIREASILVLQLEIPIECVQRAAMIAHQAGVRVILNTAPAHTLPRELLQQVDILISNSGEAAMLAGMHEDNPPEILAQRLFQLCPNNVVITLGGRGALLIDSEGSESIPSYPVKVVDTTAAGDAFVGGMAAALVTGKTVREAVRRGNAAGALACTRLGAQPSLPTLAGLTALMERRGG